MVPTYGIVDVAGLALAAFWTLVALLALCWAYALGVRLWRSL
jgi:hypothetical protein